MYLYEMAEITNHDNLQCLMLDAIHTHKYTHITGCRLLLLADTNKWRAVLPFSCNGTHLTAENVRRSHSDDVVRLACLPHFKIPLYWPLCLKISLYSDCL